jgi:hypothetical protein
MKENFQKLNTLNDIKTYCETYSSEDGEGIDFELKGSAGKKKLDKDLKKKLAKEICAFANTYGGILCYHFGSDDNIVPFNESDINTDFTPIENWLKDCLEPRILGIDIKKVDNVILIYVPQSKTKPHRTTTDRQYSYRNCTSSIEMPEIMISSMYRSQDYLLFDIVLSVSKSILCKQLNFIVFVKNQSNIAGSKIKIQSQIFKKIGINKDLGLAHDNETYLRSSHFTFSNIFSDLQIPSCGTISTNLKFAENILYPLDKILYSFDSKIIDDFSDIKYLIVQIDVMMKETSRNTKYFLVQVNNEGNCPIIMKADKTSLIPLITKYKSLEIYSAT